MDSVTRDILRRLRWRQWVAKGILLGLLAATSVALLLIATEPATWQQRWPALVGTAYQVYLGIGVLTLISLLVALGRWRHSPVLIVLAAFVAIGFELLVLGPGPHLLRLPLAAALGYWAARTLLRPA
ncbi:hypothetical protein C7S18_00670 [Ahniella affigens]|uniref:Uncharacterized protein n=1 Tax=Ahniella affigens TaxID=2021234 RepID=A0A2P1PLT6_9GAMM|nr:hypothetical protein [Ahniella affigens]AVP95800.1 hypothetical protein C7S18_00670 [Ahniella affigens]